MHWRLAGAYMSISSMVITRVITLVGIRCHKVRSHEMSSLRGDANACVDWPDIGSTIMKRLLIPVIIQHCPNRWRISGANVGMWRPDVRHDI